MEVPLQSLLDEMLAKTERLTLRQKDLESRLAESQKRIASLEYDLREAREETERVRSERDFLEVSHRLADNPDALVRTRRHIARLIRRLDSSIAMLEDDPAL